MNERGKEARSAFQCASVRECVRAYAHASACMCVCVCVCVFVCVCVCTHHTILCKVNRDNELNGRTTVECKQRQARAHSKADWFPYSRFNFIFIGPHCTVHFHGIHAWV